MTIQKIHPLAALILVALAVAQLQAMDQNQKVLHVLNRLTFGPRPGDLERVKAMGLKAYITKQLNPDKLDDRVCEKELERYPILGESINSLLMEYPQPGINLLRPDLRDKRLSPMEEGNAYTRLYGMATTLSEAKLTRAVLSERQLFEVMADFWFNHFNVDFDKDLVQWFLIPYERDVIRAHALGKFKDLLVAVAKSPAMLIYLDNNDNHADPNYKPVARAEMGGTGSTMMMEPPPGKGARINENYARELLELHTMGVDGGYTQHDVVETARVFTGWAVAGTHPDSAPQTVEFRFKLWHHDSNPKVILGQTFDQGGVAEGEAVLAMLAGRPETAHFIAKKLCQRFVADDPPAALVDSVARKFLESDGDIKETMRAIFSSPEFFDPEYYRAKVKTPLEFVASALRAVGAHPDNWTRANETLDSMGQPLYRCEPPTGYAQTAGAWVSSTALLGRTNFSAGLFNEEAPGFSLAPFEKGVSIGGQKVALENAFALLLNNEVSEATRQTLSREEPTLDTKKIVALVMASPDFQRR